MTNRDQNASTCQARWVPRWHELDQSLRVGQVGNFLFFPQSRISDAEESRAVDDAGNPSTQGIEDLIFFNALIDGNTPIETRNARVIAIVHHELGTIESVDTNGLDYVFRFLDGAEWIVNAEEEPGVSYDCDNPPATWELRVTLADVSSPGVLGQTA